MKPSEQIKGLVGETITNIEVNEDESGYLKCLTITLESGDVITISSRSFNDNSSCLNVDLS